MGFYKEGLKKVPPKVLKRIAKIKKAIQDTSESKHYRQETYHEFEGYILALLDADVVTFKFINKLHLEMKTIFNNI